MAKKNDSERALELLKESHKQSSIDKVVGKPITHKDDMVIPLGHYLYGFGFGLESDQDAGEDGKERESAGPARMRAGGGGGGVWTFPAAVIHISPDEVEIKSVLGPAAVVLMALFWAIAVGVWARAFRARWEAQAAHTRAHSGDGSVPIRLLPSEQPLRRRPKHYD